MSALAAWLAESALMRSPIGGLMKRFWKPLLIALAILAAFLLHQHVAGKAVAAAEKRGADRAYASIQKQADELARKTHDLAAKIRSHTDEEARHIAAGADDLRLRGPGKASCAGSPAPSSSGPVSTGRPVVPGLPDVQGEQWEPLVGLPYGETVDFAEVCDLNRNEVLAWRDWYVRVGAEWAKRGTARSSVSK